MKTLCHLLAGAGVAVAILLLGSAAAAPHALAQKASAGSLVVLADFVQGAPNPYPDVPPCVQLSRFPQGSNVVVRIRVIDGATGQALSDSDLSGIQVAIDGQAPLNARYGNHPGGPGPATDQFWSAAWKIPADYPTGAVDIAITATAMDGRFGTWMPFQVAASGLTVIPATSSAPAAPSGS